MIVGITGGIGCGKSKVGRLFEQRGFSLIDSDALVRERVLPCAGVVAAVRSRYGTGVLADDGTIDRAKLGVHVFSHDEERRWLEDLTHPLVFAIWREAFAARPDQHWAVEVPLLFEKGLENWFDFTVCVACSPDRQLARLEQRGLPRGLALFAGAGDLIVAVMALPVAFAPMAEEVRARAIRIWSIVSLASLLASAGLPLSSFRR